MSCLARNVPRTQLPAHVGKFLCPVIAFAQQPVKAITFNTDTDSGSQNADLPAQGLSLLAIRRRMMQPRYNSTVMR
jgi:hypothetical protein